MLDEYTSLKKWGISVLVALGISLGYNNDAQGQPKAIIRYNGTDREVYGLELLIGTKTSIENAIERASGPYKNGTTISVSDALLEQNSKYDSEALTAGLVDNNADATITIQNHRSGHEDNLAYELENSSSRHRASSSQSKKSLINHFEQQIDFSLGKKAKELGRPIYEVILEMYKAWRILENTATEDSLENYVVGVEKIRGEEFIKLEKEAVRVTLEQEKKPSYFYKNEMCMTSEFKVEELYRNPKELNKVMNQAGYYQFFNNPEESQRLHEKIAKIFAELKEEYISLNKLGLLNQEKTRVKTILMDHRDLTATRDWSRIIYNEFEPHPERPEMSFEDLAEDARRTGREMKRTNERIKSKGKRGR